MWSYPTNHEHCCIYRVPQRLRRVNPEAYTPQLVLIGPLHHHLKSQALESRGDIINTNSMGYLNMDEHKKIYLAEFAQKFEDENTIDGFRKIIKADEETIRASYSESTSWIKSSELVEMILLDSVFIIEHMLRITDASSRTEDDDAGADNKRLRSKKTRDDNAQAYYQGSRREKTGDLIVDDPCLQITVKEDLMLLENQLPYFILEKLFDTIIPRLRREETLRKLILGYFGFQSEMIKVNSRFIHFTDLLRCVRVDILGSEKTSKTKFRCLADLFRRGRRETPKVTNIRHMYNAEKLYSAGMKFVVVKDEFSIDVRFENGCLRIPSLWVRDDMELILRNIMALEQCHYPFKAYVCNFVTFLDFLIDSGKDVDFLIEKGILNNWIGEQRSVAEMVNKLCLGIFENESYYADIATKVNAYYECPIHRTRAVLSRKYFCNLWTGTATVAATLLLVMTLIQTVVSVIDVMQR
ncbi:hypothetical protein AALP_AA6G172600 [Arabis alpina]|uniref:Uncharacterized protein n=1 Tax=Arabis alpina TaxID=50452 RepID=A0A087GPU0_ARAAL|nr:hypothetical protein AALP_AA6G172600 [Arabis alpina]